MRLSQLKESVCGTDRLVVEGVRVETRAVVVESRDGEGEEAVTEEQEWFLSVRPYKRDSMRCPHCGRRCRGYDRSPRRRWRALDLGQSRCSLEYAPMRVSCPEHGVVTESVSWADHGARLTRAMDDAIAWAMCHLTASATKELLRVGSSTIAGACERVLGRAVDQDALLDGVERLGVDETGWGRHRVMTVVVDHDRCRVVWCADGIGADVLQGFFDLMGPERCALVRLASRDGAAWIEKAFRDNLPNATQVMDPFHVVKWATEALDEVRRGALREAREAYRALPRAGRGRPAKGDADAKARAVALARVREIEGTRWPLLKDPADLTEGQRETLGLISRRNRALYRAYALKEGLRDVFSVGAAEGCAEELLDVWLSRSCRSKIEEFVELSRSVRKRRGEILAAVEHGISNSRLEAVNNKIKVAIRMGYGFASFASLRAIVMLRCCGVRMSLPGRVPPGWRTKGSARRTRENMSPRDGHGKVIKDAA